MSEQKLNEFVNIYENYFNESISKTEALKKALKIINIIKIIYCKSFNETEK